MQVKAVAALTCLGQPENQDLTTPFLLWSKRVSNFLGATARPDPSDRTMAKPTTIKIRLNSTADTGYFYVTKKNPRNLTEKLVLKKYDPVVRKHVEFKEGKIK